MSENITNNPSVPTQVVAEVKFPRFINNLGIIPTSYKDSMSYYETLAWLCKYLEETVMPTINQNGRAIQELQALYIQLNEYVTHYFDNLDVQEEINNKLDDMVEAGTLQEIISEYLNSTAIFGFDTIDDMKAGTNLVNGSYAKTLGGENINDGFSCLFHIVDDESLVADNYQIIELNNGLKATLVKENGIANECTCQHYIDNETKTNYWIAHAPNKDRYGNVLKLKLGFADDKAVPQGYLETASEFANRHNATICVNAGVADNTGDNQTGYKFGLRMKNGQLISNRASTLWQIHWALGITANNELVSFGPEQTPEEALQLGCVDVTSGFTPILLNGQSQKFQIEYTDQWYTMTQTSDVTPQADKSYYTHNNTAPYYTVHSNLDSFTPGITYYEITNIKGQRNMIGQNSTTKDIYFIATNGKGSFIDQGMTTDKMVQIFQSLGCDFAYQLDGGGSTALVYKGVMQNQFTDENNTEIRKCADFLYVGYEKMNTQSVDIRDINERCDNIEIEAKKKKAPNLNIGYLLEEGDDLNDIKDVGTYYTTSGTISRQILNTPDFTNDFPYASDCQSFKLFVNKIKTGVVVQTLIYESSHNYIFNRMTYYYGGNFIWGNWYLVSNANEEKGYTITVNEGFTKSNDMCVMKNKRVLVSAEISGTFNTHNPTSMFTLPSGLKPKKYIMTSCVGIDSSSHVVGSQLTVQSDGVVRATCPSACNKVRFSVSFDI